MGRTASCLLVELAMAACSTRRRSSRPRRASRGRSSRRRLTFVSDAADVVSFAFDGEFASLGNFPLEPLQGVILRGRLQRLAQGRVSGELAARFRNSPGDQKRFFHAFSAFLRVLGGEGFGYALTN